MAVDSMQREDFFSQVNVITVGVFSAFPFAAKVLTLFMTSPFWVIDEEFDFHIFGP